MIDKRDITYYTIAFRYTTEDGEPCNPPPHIIEKLVLATKELHEIGFAMDVIYGQATNKTFIKMDKEMQTWANYGQKNIDQLNLVKL